MNKIDTAPTYTIIKRIAKNSAPNSKKKIDVNKYVLIKKRTEVTEFLEIITKKAWITIKKSII